jgi:hypothetical protein
MKRAMSLFSLVFAGGAIVLSALLQTGCEEAKGLQGLQVDPSSATLRTNNQTVVFTVTGGITNETLALPLYWAVKDEGLGRIVSSSGFMAIYQRTDRNGVNAVTVRDQYENEGYATVDQSSENYSLTLEASDTTVAIGEAVTIRVITESAQAPFAWRLVSGPGSVSGSGASAGYSSTTTGVAVIEATDANGASGVIAITVADAASDDGGSGGGPGGTDP